MSVPRCCPSLLLTSKDIVMSPMEMSNKWHSFISELFVYRNTVVPMLTPQLVTAFVLGIFAQLVKVALCGADVIVSAECETTFDITAHAVVSVSLGFLLVFRTDWAYDRYNVYTHH